ncbi:uncharacterized protein LOC106533804 [Austrofundulus limnaeus]|uniref:DNA-directed DNA polymerase n=1 Tax=Austrofundulus limnaeus TaxID=52670 RepID=A0A2I4D0F1_AUSLI|nr:PREDICTED: uncharacterized protein LOC106533804 [Austrofundulus limnaeus]
MFCTSVRVSVKTRSVRNDLRSHERETVRFKKRSQIKCGSNLGTRVGKYEKIRPHTRSVPTELQCARTVTSSRRFTVYGGCTCAVWLLFSAQLDETVEYMDFCSLYPSVNAEGVYPIGHPKIIYRDFDEPENYFGFIRATVEPPRKLFFPVLPFKTSRGKLVFTLCRTCAETNNQRTSCFHSQQDRALTGVWTTVEFNASLAAGYRVLKTTQVWHFEQKSDKLFINYINRFLKNKQESSGFPPEVTDEEGKQKYIHDYFTHQGIQLGHEKIQQNPARRHIAKLCLNSFWGKFAQRSNQTQTTIVKEPDQLFDFLFSGKHKVSYFHFLNTEAIRHRPPL